MLTNGEQKQLDCLEIGDEILAVDHLEIVSTEMIFMLDKQRSKQGFYSILVFLFSLIGYKISLTDLHLIPIISSNKKMNYISARQVQLGDQ
ncbi:unnamed protein product, partial [Rotaria sordida]